MNFLYRKIYIPLIYSCYYNIKMENGQCRMHYKNSDIEQYNKCDECNGYLYMCPSCDMSKLRCTCGKCKTCGRRYGVCNYEFKHYDLYCTCNFNPDYYYKIFKQQINKRSRVDPGRLVDPQFYDNCFRIDAGGLIYYMEITIVNDDYDGEIAVVDEAGIFCLMNGKRSDTAQAFIKGIGVYWSNHCVRVKKENESIGFPVDKFNKGDVIGIKVTNNKRNVILTLNGDEIKDEMNCLSNVNFEKRPIFYVDFPNALIKINDGTKFKELLYKKIESMIFIKKTNYCDIKCICQA